MVENATLAPSAGHRIDQLLQYILVRAAQEDDWRDRELGPIHLLKYVYLADLAYAQRHDGQTFTGAAWQFYHFGPWQAAVHARIDTALAEIGAERKTLPSAKYDDDVTRFSIAHDVDVLRETLERDLPLGVAQAVSHAVHEFGSNTSALLRHVYLTDPIVRSAPGEILVFRALEPRDPDVPDARNALTAKQRRQRKEILAALKDKVRDRLGKRLAKRPPLVAPAPRYDEVFAAGTEWLDVLAGEPVENVEGDLTVSPGRDYPTS